MTATCIITNFNYGKYLSQAVDSVVSQVTPFDEIIVVDDASTDESPTVLSNLSEQISALKVILRKENGGQLAAFETGIAQSSGDILFFLDADDIYSREYLGIALQVYRQLPDCDFLFCGYKQFHNDSFPIFPYAARSDFKVTDLGMSAVRVHERRAFIGAPTSCLSLRTKLAMEFFPIPLHEDWRSRADDCLVFGASLAGARKVRLESDLVGYRIHGKNAFASNPGVARPEIFFRRQIALLRLFNVLRSRLNLNGEELGKLAHLEFKTIPNPREKDLCEYRGYVLKNGAKDAGRVRAMALIMKRFVETRFVN